MIKEDVNNQGLRELFEKEYNIEFTDSEYNELQAVLFTYDVKFNEVSFIVAESIENYVNFLTQYRTMTFKRKNFNMQLGEIVYEYCPTIHPVDENYETNYPQHIHHKLSADYSDKLKSFDYDFQFNVALMRELSITGTEANKEISSFYTFVIYNSNLDVRAGIRFEKI